MAVNLLRCFLCWLWIYVFQYEGCLLWCCTSLAVSWARQIGLPVENTAYLCLLSTLQAVSLTWWTDCKWKMLILSVYSPLSRQSHGLDGLAVRGTLDFSQSMVHTPCMNACLHLCQYQSPCLDEMAVRGKLLIVRVKISCLPSCKILWGPVGTYCGKDIGLSRHWYTSCCLFQGWFPLNTRGLYRAGQSSSLSWFHSDSALDHPVQTGCSTDWWGSTHFLSPFLGIHHFSLLSLFNCELTASTMQCYKNRSIAPVQIWPNTLAVKSCLFFKVEL